MLQDVINRSDQDPSLEKIPTPCLFDFSTDSEFFEGEIFQNSEVLSSSGCGTENICCFDTTSFTSDFPTLREMDTKNVVTLKKYPPTYLLDIDNKVEQSYIGVNQTQTQTQTPSISRCCPFLANSFLSGNSGMPMMSTPNVNGAMQKTESITLDCQHNNDHSNFSFFGNIDPPHQQQSYNQTDMMMQSIYGENQTLLNGGGGGGGYGNSSQLLPSDICTSGLDESSYKVRKLTMEERRERINRYRKKKNERNFSKKIKYACRKTLADSRPRVRGRFAKNEECGDGNHDYEDEEEAGNKEELMDSSDNYPQIFNPFTCDFTTIESWM